EHAARRGGPPAGETVLVRISRPGVARQELADREAVGGPMPLEVVQELVPALQAVAVHIALRERESMVDAHDDRRLASDLGGQPLGQLAAAPKAVFVGRIA